MHQRGGDVMVRDMPSSTLRPLPSALGSVDRLRTAADGKAQAARDVCAASVAFASCSHRRRRRQSPTFVDWYLVLAVGEAVSEDAVRRRYRHLALQLHPDKNRHPKAEMAFKIVSEAHACLTDKACRRAFDAERSTAFCAVCHDRARAVAAAKETRTLTPSDHHRQHLGGSIARSRVGGRGRSTAAPSAMLREVQNRLREECRVIDDCLHANGTRRRQSFPLFDPSDKQMFPNYPHTRPLPGMFWPAKDRSCFGDSEPT